MILTCPSCSSSFKVPEGAITEAGRKVRCATCGHVWHATLKDVQAPRPHMQQPRPQAPRPQQARPQPPRPQMQPMPAQPNQGQQGAGSADEMRSDLQALARPSAQPMPPVMPKDQAQAQTAAIRAAMMAEAGKQTTPAADLAPHSASAHAPESDYVDDYADDLTDDLVEGGVGRSAQQQTDTSGLADLLDGANGFTTDGTEKQARKKGTADPSQDLDAHDTDGLGPEGLGALLEEQGLTGTGLSHNELMEKYLGGDDDDPIMQHRMQQKRDYERRLALRKKIVKNFFLWTTLIAWLAAAGLVMFMPDKVKQWWPASQVLFDMVGDKNEEIADVKEIVKKQLEANGLPTKLSPSPSEAVQNLFIEKPQYEIIEREDGQYLRIWGQMENKSNYALKLPILEGQIIGQNGDVIKRWRFQADGEVIGKNIRVPYNSVTPWPLPAGAESVNIDFIWDDQTK